MVGNSRYRAPAYLRRTSPARPAVGLSIMKSAWLPATCVTCAEMFRLIRTSMRFSFPTSTAVPFRPDEKRWFLTSTYDRSGWTWRMT